MFSPRLPIRVVQLFSLVLALSGLLFLATSCGGSKANTRSEANVPAQPPAVEVTTATAIVRELPRFFEATGSLSGDEQTDVSPSIAGKVSVVAVEMGSYVKRGQTLVRLDDVDAKLRVQQGQAQVDQAKAALRQAEEKVGVRPGQAFDINKLPEVANAHVALELAEKNLRRAEKLIESGDVSRSAYDQQKAQRDQLKEQYESALSLARQNYAAVDVARTNVANSASGSGGTTPPSTGRSTSGRSRVIRSGCIPSYIRGGPEKFRRIATVAFVT